MFVLDPLLTQGVAGSCCLLADSDTGVAAAIASLTNVELYESLGKRRGVTTIPIVAPRFITDLTSGNRSSADPGRWATMSMPEVQAEFEFPTEMINIGRIFGFGSCNLIARQTTGNTAEHRLFLLGKESHFNWLWTMFTDGSLFVGCVGVPDLTISGETGQLTKSLYHICYDVYRKLEDYVTSQLGHSGGAARRNGRNDPLLSSIGHQRCKEKHPVALVAMLACLIDGFAERLKQTCTKRLDALTKKWRSKHVA